MVLRDSSDLSVGGWRLLKYILSTKYQYRYLTIRTSVSNTLPSTKVPIRLYSAFGNRNFHLTIYKVNVNQ